ncbi:MAG: hypothetical protein WA771_05180 [Chthoniobacterales bacterium]
MMISQRWNNRRAFTFFELALALGLIAIVFVGIAPVISASVQERRLRAGIEEIAELARAARSEALAGGSNQTLFFEKGGIARWNADSEEAEVVVAPPDDAALKVRFPDEKWSVPDGQRWRFFPAGMVTPLSVRLEEGDGWIEADFDFLTGRIGEERFSF